MGDFLTWAQVALDGAIILVGAWAMYLLEKAKQEEQEDEENGRKNQEHC